MKLFGILTAGLALLTLMGCGGGGSKVGTIVGAWRWAGLATSDSGGAASVTCPGTLNVDGSDISCSASDLTIFTEDGYYQHDLRPDGQRVRLTGSYSQTGNNLSFLVDRISVDLDDSGTFSGDETEELAETMVYRGRLTKLDGGAMGLVYEYEDYSYAVVFERTSL